MRRRVLPLGLLAAVVGAGALLLATSSGSRGTKTADAGQATAGGATSSVAVSRQDLEARTEVDGTLGYAGQHSVSGQLQGTVTSVPEAGTVVERASRSMPWTTGRSASSTATCRHGGGWPPGWATGPT